MNVAVLLSYYNGSKFIEEQIRSLLEQVHVNIDIYIRDDGSPKKEELNELVRVCAGYNNVYLIKSDNLGVVGGFYSLLSIVDGYDYYCFCDQDDFWYPDKVYKAITKLENIALPALYCSSYDLTDENLELLPLKSPNPVPTFNNAIFKNFCTGCTCVINKQLRNEILCRYFNTKIPMHDWWFLLVAYITGIVIYDHNANLQYRQHSSNVVGGIDTFPLKLRRFIKHISTDNTSRSQMMRDLLSMSEGHKKVNLCLLKDLIDSQKSFLSRVIFLKNYKFSYRSKLDRVSVYITILLGRF